jgi:hypothetical protein
MSYILLLFAKRARQGGDTDRSIAAPIFFRLVGSPTGRTAIAMGSHCNAARRPRILQDFTTATGGDIYRR